MKSCSTINYNYRREAHPSPHALSTAGGGNEMRIELEREEALACVMALERWKRKGEWGKSALGKLLKVMGLKSLAPTKGEEG